MRARLLILLAAALVCVPAGTALAQGPPIMPLSQVQPGMNCTGETVVQGTTISSFNVHVIDVAQAPGEGPRILIQASGPAVDSTGVAEGFSGSPVYCPDSFGTMENVGAISEGIGEYGNSVALVTPIEQMLGEPVYPPPSAPRLAVKPRPLLGPLTVGGLSPALFDLLQRAAERAGRLVVAAPAGQSPSFPVQQLVPGASVSASYSSGAIALGAVGTVTYVDGQTVYAFGHELDGAGRRSLLLQDAYVYYVVNNPDPTVEPSYKLAVPGHTVGTVSSDTPNAVVGEVGAGPPAVPVDVTAVDLDTGNAIALHSQVADETDIGLPLGDSQVDTVAPLEVAQAATQIYDGPPANESGRMCLWIYLRETPAPLKLCDRYVGTGVPGDSGSAPPELASAASADVTSAFGVLERVNFASLQVTRVVAHLYATRGLAEGEIVGARAPFRVRAGRTVRIRLLVRVYRGPLKTVAVRIRIPAGAHGPLTATVGGPETTAPQPPGAASGGLSASLTAALSGTTPPVAPNEPPIESLDELQLAVAQIPTYDGLYLSLAGHGTRRMYRDPALLITGRTQVAFDVTR
jgi:hypothetical protein